MPTFIQMPKLSMTMETGTVQAWLKREGDPVAKGEIVLEIETDKAVHEVEAEADGVLRRIYVEEGQEVPVTAVIAVIAGPDESVPATPPDSQDAAPAPNAAPAPRPADRQAPPPRAGRVKISPVAKKLAAEHGIAPETLVGTGAGGRIEKQDVLRVLETRAVPAQAPQGDVLERIVLEGMRGAIARRVAASVREIPHVYFTVTCDATQLVRARNRSLESIESETGERLSYNDLIVQLTAAALAQHPRLNATLADNTITVHRPVHIGIVVNVGDGLYIPVIRDVAGKNLRELVAQRKALVERAHAGRLAPRDMEGGTFTISNLGATGIEGFTAIINPPQVAILSVGSIVERAGIYNAQIVMHPTIQLTLGVDHRALDGHAAALFLVTLRDHLEQPMTVLRV